MLHNLNLNFVQFSVSKVQNCIPLSPCLPPGKSLREIRFWGFAIFVQTFSLPQIMAHLLRGGVCTWHTMPPGPLRPRKCGRIFWLLFPSFLTQEEDLLWREDVLSKDGRHNNRVATRLAGQLTTKHGQ